MSPQVLGNIGHAMITANSSLQISKKSGMFNDPTLGTKDIQPVWSRMDFVFYLASELSLDLDDLMFTL